MPVVPQLKHFWRTRNLFSGERYSLLSLATGAGSGTDHCPSSASTDGNAQEHTRDHR
jgi:hypothetical protein